MGTTPGEHPENLCIICDGYGWVCEKHPDTKWTGDNSCCFGGVGMPCICNSLTAQEVNALEPRVRAYIHELTAGYDPRGDCRQQVIELHLARETAEALALENLRLHKIIQRLMREYWNSTHSCITRETHTDTLTTDTIRTTLAE